MLVEAVCFAVTLTAPEASSVCELSPAIVALVITVGSEIAASAVNTTSESLLVPETPEDADVVSLSVLVALRVTAFAPEISAPSSIEAVVVSLTLLIAAPAPIPTVPVAGSYRRGLDRAGDRRGRGEGDVSR